MSKYIATPDDVQKDKEAFYSKFGPHGGRETTGPQWDPNRIARRWAYMLDSQNGENFDDYIMTENNKITRYLERWSPAPGRALILGTGTGREVYAAKELGYDAVGTTLGKENRAFAKWKFDLDLDYIDNCTMPYPSKSFDIVAGFQVFEHCHSPYLFLFECCRVLKEGGLLILEWPPFMATADGTVTPNPGQMHNFMFDYDDDNLHHACCWTAAQGRIMTRRCNFENVEVYMSGYKDGGRSQEEAPNTLTLITEDHPAYFSNIGSGDLVLKANRRPDSRMPGYARQLLEA